MEKDGNMARLEKELKAYKPLLGQAADTILDKEVSKYPIFVLHQQGVSIGLPLLEGEGQQVPWSVNATTLEELATKKVISMERVEDFKGIYRDPRAFLCLFVLSDSGADFVFMPR
jgi:hypothetical protein